MFRKMKVLLCLLLLLSMVPIQRAEAAQVETEGYIQQLISYYRHYQQDAAGDIQRVLDEMCAENLEEGARWTEIMNSWRWINEQMPVQSDVLPDGLAEDNRLCIVVMGFALETNGSMKPELISRLEVALESARKYPNAILVCTGGATSQRADITEAGQMKKWLTDAGVEEDRIIMETRAVNTLQNAVMVYELLQRNHPQVNQIAIITSDYHVYRSMTLFCAETILKDLPYDVVANAACITELAGERELEKQANNLAELASVRLSNVPKPELHVLATEPTAYTQQTETVLEKTDLIQVTQPTAVTQPSEPSMETAPAAEEGPEETPEETQRPVFAVVGFAGSLLLALVLLLILIRLLYAQRK